MFYATFIIMNLPKELTTVTKLSKYLAMVVFIALPFVGFFLGVRYQEMMDLSKRQQEESNLAIPRAPTPTPIAIPTVDPSITANWKTYNDNKDGFSVKYDSSSINAFQINKDDLRIFMRDVSSLPQFVKYKFPEFITGLRIGKNLSTDIYGQQIEPFIFSLWVFKNPDNITINEWFNRYSHYPFEVIVQEAEASIEEKRPNKDTVIGGVTAKYSIFSGPTGLQTAYFISKDGKIYLILTLADPHFQKIGDQILSTFRFTSL